MAIDETTAAAIGLAAAALGGLTRQLLDQAFGRTNRRFDAEIQEVVDFRKQLKAEVDSLRTEIEKVEQQLDSWREKYFILLAEHNELKVKHEALVERINQCQTAAGSLCPWRA